MMNSRYCDEYDDGPGYFDDFYDDVCYECSGYGDDYYIDENGELVSACDDCSFNGREEDD